MSCRPRSGNQDEYVVTNIDAVPSTGSVSRCGRCRRCVVCVAASVAVVSVVWWVFSVRPPTRGRCRSVAATSTFEEGDSVRLSVVERLAFEYLDGLSARVASVGESAYVIGDDSIIFDRVGGRSEEAVRLAECDHSLGSPCVVRAVFEILETIRRFEVCLGV